MDIERFIETINVIQFLLKEHPEHQNQIDLVDNMLQTLAVENAYLTGRLDGTQEAIIKYVQ